MMSALELTNERRAQALVATNAAILQRIARHEALPDVLDALVRRIETHAGGMLASVLLVDEAGTHLRHGAAPSLPSAYNSAIDGIGIGPLLGSCGSAASRRSPVVVHDVASDPLWREFRELAATHGIGACWSTPILSASGELLGTFALYYREPRGPEPAHLELIEAGTHLARTAIEHARFEQALERREAQLAEAQRMAQLGSWELDIATGAMTWSDGLFRVLGIEPGEVRPSVEALLERIHPSDRARAQAIITTAMQDSRPFSVEQRVIRADGSVRLVQARGHVLVDDAGAPRRISGTMQDLTQLKVALAARRESEIRYEQEHRIAEVLQRSLLPDVLAKVPGLDIAARYLPGSDGVAVGGDWYDVFPLRGGAIGLVIGDVVGRGLGAAATMGQLRIALRAYALIDPSPARVITRLSDLVESLGHGEMTTVVYGVYEPSTGTMRVACAGHLPPLVIERTGAVRYVEEATCVPLGMVRLAARTPASSTEVTAEVTEAVVHLDLGSKMVLYTDGLVERRRASLDEGLLSLAEAARTSSGDGEQLCEHLLERMLGDGHSGDDVALLVLEPVLSGGA